MKWKLIASILVVVMIAGCGENPLQQGKKRRGPAMQLGGQLTPADQGEPPPPPPPPPETPEKQDTGSTSVPPPPPPPPPPPAEAKPAAEHELAKVGVTGKGQGYAPGPITTPIAAYFRTRERVVFDVQIASAMNLYKAEHGRFPKTHEEFLAKIINAGLIQLPKLDSGDRYVYDPQKGATLSTSTTKDPP